MGRNNKRIANHTDLRCEDYIHVIEGELETARGYVLRYFPDRGTYKCKVYLNNVEYEKTFKREQLKKILA
jgi:ribosomal protein L24